MDIQNKVVLKVEIDEKEYLFLCENDAPLGGAFDAVNSFRAYVIGKMNEAVKADEAKKEEVKEPESQEVNNGGCCGN